MIIQTPQQRANTLYALNEMWPRIPAAEVIPDLRWYRSECGTLACFGGFVAVDDHFQCQGVESVGGSPVLLKDGERFSGSYASAELFGDHTLFARRGELEHEDNFEGTDHELVSRRLRSLLENSEVVL